MKKTIIIEGMSCDHCVMSVKKELESLSCTDNVEVEIGKAVVECSDIDDNALIEAVEEAGYTVKEIIAENDEKGCCN
ncbi:heavy metal binding protein [Deferribacter desulfuricans SSM1]|uniref:Heavy metal binding protein n=1 Tax=Deferribacter desulfuricans (strain DSM 14783 / JCM 11476 / NBRC 101012 / SSM1) TaxID=639282 RepID=D3PB33_DEFDS|nr:heavy-metal-associated domain-containing protein [Deferribacter desulfuricans]BAI79806.1 heavy metal binding protein [Deferribacter desulfuricans SSM1]